MTVAAIAATGLLAATQLVGWGAAPTGGVSVAATKPAPIGVQPPIPPQPYTIPPGATILGDGVYNGLTVRRDVYARDLGKVTINGTVTFKHGSLHGVVVNGHIDISNNTGPGDIEDSWVHAQGGDVGIYAYRPEGLIVQRVVIDGFTNVGLRASANAIADDSKIKRLWDLRIRGGNQKGVTGGTGEVALWVGQSVEDGVRRVNLSGAYTAELERVNNAHDTVYTDIRAVNDVGPGAAIYDEHYSDRLVTRRFYFGGRPNATRVVQTEYRANFDRGAADDDSFDQGIVVGGQIGFNFEDAAKPSVTNTRFVGQTSVAIRFFNCTGQVQANNDFSRIGHAKQVAVA